MDDLAFLCSIYSDVCDQATITICMIEAARARAASDSLPEDERQSQQLRLKVLFHCYYCNNSSYKIVNIFCYLHK